MSEQLGGDRPAGIRPVPDPNLTDGYDAERARRRWKLHQQRKHAQHCNALDRHLGVIRTDNAVPIDWDQFALGVAERRAAGLALREAA